jgi:hypothetical protein
MSVTVLAGPNDVGGLGVAGAPAFTDLAGVPGEAAFIDGDADADGVAACALGAGDGAVDGAELAPERPSHPPSATIAAISATQRNVRIMECPSPGT